jgi:hypothetical protein
LFSSFLSHGAAEALEESIQEEFGEIPVVRDPLVQLEVGVDQLLQTIGHICMAVILSASWALKANSSDNALISFEISMASPEFRKVQTNEFA